MYEIEHSLSVTKVHFFLSLHSLNIYKYSKISKLNQNIFFKKVYSYLFTVHCFSNTLFNLYITQTLIKLIEVNLIFIN
jgi:hypothetical protein